MEMHILKFATAALLMCALATEAAAEGFKAYPGATEYTPPDSESTRKWKEALPPGITIVAYITHDSFEKVVSFYKSSAKEYSNPRAQAGGKLPNGREMQRTFLIFDGASDLRTSRSWAKVQHPFIGSVSYRGSTPQFSDIRDVTEIVLTQKPAAPKKK